MKGRTLADLGWNAFFAEAFDALELEDVVPARLIRDNKITLGALTVDDGEFEEHEVILSGKVYHAAETDAALPAVGDWVALDLNADSEFPVIRACLPRQTCFSRKGPGMSAEEQVIAANVTSVAVVTDAGTDFSLRRLERYFTIIGRSGASTVVVINKSDLFTKAELSEVTNAIKVLQPAAEVHVVSALEKKGLTALRKHFQTGCTVALIGSSGVGKSELVNALLGGDYQWTGEVDEGTGKGKHTTTARELMVLRKGGIIIDNPGIKEIQMWTDETTLRERFHDLAELAGQCQYGDCKHGTDKGCAVQAAIRAGTLDGARLQAFLRLEDEIAELHRRRKKRQMTLERRGKREHRIQARNLADRREHERRLKPRAHRDGEDLH
jgi:ribosome biogenesis GTPase / thiamine phosphate phosphatase